MNQQVATELLESAGAIVTVANHGGEAVEILTAKEEPPPFDVVFMDMQMPVHGRPDRDEIAAYQALPAEPADHRDDRARAGGGAAALPGCGDERPRQQADRSRCALCHADALGASASGDCNADDAAATEAASESRSKQPARRAK